jgi:hypothetical protein
MLKIQRNDNLVEILAKSPNLPQNVDAYNQRICVYQIVQNYEQDMQAIAMLQRAIEERYAEIREQQRKEWEARRNQFMTELSRWPKEQREALLSQMMPQEQNDDVELPTVEPAEG